MAQVYNNNDPNSSCSLSQDNILNLVNEKLREPTKQQRISKLQNYFLGYKAYLEQPPSPAPSDEGQLFSYNEQSSAILDGVPLSTPSPRVLIQNPLKEEFQRG
jgi:hypothetical protein